MYYNLFFFAPSCEMEDGVVTSSVSPRAPLPHSLPNSRTLRQRKQVSDDVAHSARPELHEPSIGARAREDWTSCTAPLRTATLQAGKSAPDCFSTGSLAPRRCFHSPSLACRLADPDIATPGDPTQAGRQARTNGRLVRRPSPDFGGGCLY